LNGIILNPIWFVFGIVANLGLYGPAVLLIREAKVRWHKGWATVLLLGAAYGILEEGIALSTLFNSTAGPVGQLGFYGHWLGVNWIWTSGILTVHMLFSISIPILLLGIALPETNGKSLLKSDRSIATAIGILFFDVFILFFFILLAEHFWMGAPVFGFSFLTIMALIYLARRVPADTLTPKHEGSTKRPLWFGAVGASFYPAILFAEFGGMGLHLPAVIDIALVVLVQALHLVFVLRKIGRKDNERNLIALSIGLIIPIALFGVISEIGLPIIFVGDFIAGVFFWKLWKKYPTSKQVSTPVISDRIIVNN
jgi:hypothetical protein